MDAVIRLHPESAGAWHRGAHDAPGISDLKAVLARFGLELRPQHAETSDPSLQAYFTIAGMPAAQSDRIVAALLELDVVEAAYVQPPASPA